MMNTQNTNTQNQNGAVKTEIESGCAPQAGLSLRSSDSRPLASIRGSTPPFSPSSAGQNVATPPGFMNANNAAAASLSASSGERSSRIVNARIGPMNGDPGS